MWVSLGKRFSCDEAKVVSWELAKSTVVERSEVVALVEGDCSRWVVVKSSLVVCSADIVVIDLVLLSERFSCDVANVISLNLAISKVAELSEIVEDNT